LANNLRTIALYLPQFHTIPENDAWWGAGFTEWTNVRASQPRFEGHHQPHVPTKLGYYDLRNSDVRTAQAEMAREYGISGFCYYHYWFSGKRLLETPFNEVLSTGKPDFPFCLCWANENWTRRWDGLDRDVLIAQEYSDEDSRAFMEALLPAFRDERYIRVNGKPLLLVYRTGIIPDPLRMTEIWRETARRSGIDDLYLVRVASYMDVVEPSPASLGFDAAMEFAPHWESIGASLGSLAEAGGPDVPVRHNMFVFDYERCMSNMLSRILPSYPLFRSVFPSWDNSARRKSEPSIFVNSSPEKFAFWLASVSVQTLERYQGDEQLVFINAWNEWGEGCHLEPDEHYGFSWLEGVKSVQQFMEILSAAREMTLAANGEISFSAWYDCFQRINSDEGGLSGKLAAALPVLAAGGAQLSEEEMLKRFIDLSARKDEMLSAVTSSLCWRLTAPIRAILDKVQGK